MAFKNDFKPDIIIGNPPYNNGMDIDFLIDAHKIAKIGTSFIVPSKWQTAEADQRIDSIHSYGDFRREVVPHMSKVVFYPDCKDIFDIFQTDGITWYIEGKNIVESCEIVNKSLNIKCFNSTNNRRITEGQSLLNIGNEVVNKLDLSRTFKFMNITHSKRYEVWINTKISGFDWYNTKEPRYVISISRILDNEKLESYNGEAKCIFESNSIEECKNFLSWIYSKTVRFLLIPNISKLNNIFTSNCFKFVPFEDKFDHQYTDDELIAKYGIQDYKDIINKLVKTRNIEEMLNNTKF